MQPNKTPLERKPAYSNSVSSLTSLNSFVGNGEVDDFPEPLSDVAYHGLAGDIVGRIDPHTEAHPAALLIQFLIAFGNVIGHEPFTVADGARHAMNLFAVLVGDTAKARKGTSLAHILAIFERADEQYRRNCLAHGLSSGEGLIWQVRDPVVGTDEGEFEDAGVADKRLIVVEGEFANVFKVIARQGSTLSPVIRSAWDSGDLRVMTKNSPVRATGAHVSIIGHITLYELRRNLTETESANGFGNRILWVAVRRSKILPERGNLQGENFNDLVSRLHRVIEFARTASEVTRDKGASELWCIVYPKLSEGKTGLLGAITARAEAQVLRLSALYALLDCSLKIRVEHHRAALALWKYCEHSAQWIFSTITGNARADQTMRALRKAGSEGITRTQISVDVFQRNVSGPSLDEALQFLRKNGYADFRMEKTTGRKPAERWFATKDLRI
jgi:hypothetical protein